MPLRDHQPNRADVLRIENDRRREDRQALIGRISRTNAGDDFLRRTGAYGLRYQQTTQDRKK